jgi:hypothetical protein
MDEALKHRLRKLLPTEIRLNSMIDELRQLNNENYSQSVVQHALEDLRAESETEQEEDRVLELLDFVTGFCSPEKTIWLN